MRACLTSLLTLTLAPLLGIASQAHAHVGDEIYPHTVRDVTFGKGENGKLRMGRGGAWAGRLRRCQTPA